MDKKLEKLMTFFSEFDCEEEKYLFEGIDNLFHGKFKTKKVIIFSIPRHKREGGTKSPLQLTRFLWNKKNLDKVYDKEIFNKRIEEIIASPKKHLKWKREESGYEIYLGKNQWQHFYVYFEVEGEDSFADDFLNLSCTFF